ncbi:NAD-glutamate dehydrogenase [soil metagenome]
MSAGSSAGKRRTPEAIAAAFKKALGAGALNGDQDRYIAQVGTDWTPDELPDWSAGEVGAAAAELWRFGESVKDGLELRIRRVDGAGEPVDILEIVQLDAPFLVASVMGEVAAQGCEVKALIHPVVTVNARRWSLIQVALTPLSDPAALEGGVRETLSDVRSAVDDFDAMALTLRETIAALDASGRASPEEMSFLRWLDGGRFVFLGARTYDYARGKGEEPIIRKGLGVLRDEDRKVLRASNEPSVIQAIRRHQHEDRAAVTVAKSNLRSRVHRRVHMDYFGVKRFDAKGEPVGEVRFVGLFTAEAYNQPVGQTPLISGKTEAVFQRAGLPEGGHSAARLRNILNAWPRDDLFQISEDELLAGAMQALRLQDRPRVDLFVRRDPFDRFASILVYVPRERYDFALVEAAGKLLAEAFGGRVSAIYPEFDDAPLARVHFIIGFEPGERREPDQAKLHQELTELARTWMDRFETAARESLAEEDMRQALGFAAALPPGYRALNRAHDALSDLAAIDALDRKQPLGVRVFRRPGDGADRLRFKLYGRKQPPALADVVPILEHMGLKAVREDGFSVHADKARVHIDEYLIEDRSGDPLALDEISGVFGDTFSAVWAERTESDGFNRLVMELGVTWREAALIRALAKYRQQSGLDPSQAVQELALSENPAIARLILDLFAARFDPTLSLDIKARQDKGAAIFAKIEEALQTVPALDADRALRRIALLVQASVRTNFYQTDPEGDPKGYISFKVCSRDLADLPAPKPFREIFISAPHVDGVHLRFGPVARGGLRWSDRRDDFRTEVLSLAKAQQVKNAVIVPVGSKGGFFPKRLPRGGAPDAIREAAIVAYKTFLCGLLDITDSIAADGSVTHPADVIIHDGDDPYLVVAADKGTASFSDIANGVAEDYGFWLGDAFASGGSVGYDHKVMGITARGAWEAVKRHFREMGKDIQSEPFTVFGVGDMSGDVFGNGMLLSKQIKLVAAFDHRHIFLDPDPDPAKSWVERDRMFKLPRSSWDDYDRKVMSKGGGVFPRSLKSIPLSEEIKTLLDLKVDALPPGELITAILKCRAELFYLGGIGAYVKATSQSHAEAGDKTNDGLRINATELRCKVVGEGANLGFTQAARIEYALGGGRINTDAIDNSAGVDSSDHEVNIKILTGMAERSGQLTRPNRNKLLESMTADVGLKVLAHNYDQTLALSLMEAESLADTSAYVRFMAELEAKGRLDRGVEGLPDARTLEARAAGGKGLTRPELAVMLAYGKLDLCDDIVASDAPDDPFFLDTLKHYFPDPLATYEDQMRQHRLRREIIATVIDNEIINRCGPTFPSRLRAGAECDTKALVKAFEAARCIRGLDDLWNAVAAQDGRTPAAGQTALFRELSYVHRGQTFWLARRLAKSDATVQTLIDAYRPGAQALLALGATLLSPVERKAAAARAKRYVQAGAPGDLADKVAGLRALTTAADLVDMASASSWPTENVARLYHHIGGALAFDTIRAAAATLGTGDTFERSAVRRLVEDLVGEQTALTAQVMKFAANAQAADSEKSAGSAVSSWIALHRPVVDKARSVVGEIEASEGGWTFAKLTIANAALRGLVA